MNKKIDFIINVIGSIILIIISIVAIFFSIYFTYFKISEKNWFNLIYPSILLLTIGIFDLKNYFKRRIKK
jgi:hypothetical protein